MRVTGRVPAPGRVLGRLLRRVPGRVAGLVPGSGRGDAGQVAAPMLLVMVSLLLLGALYAQTGSAADQRTQAQTVADAASVAAAHRLRDTTIGVSSHALPYSFSVVLQPIALVSPDLRSPACSAANENWSRNPHRTAFSCPSHLGVSVAGPRVQADVRAPAGEVVDGPADVSAQRATTTSTARVALDHCPRGLGTAERQAIADWIADDVVATLGVENASPCFTGEESVLTELEELFDDPFTTAEAIALIGEPNSIAEAVRRSFRAEIVE